MAESVSNLLITPSPLLRAVDEGGGGWGGGRGERESECV